MNREEEMLSAEVSADSLLSAVKSFLIESAAPHLEGRDRFNARVAANVLGIIQREQTIRPALQALDQDAATRWLPDIDADANIVQQLSLALARREIETSRGFLTTSRHGSYWLPRSIIQNMPVALLPSSDGNLTESFGAHVNITLNPWPPSAVMSSIEQLVWECAS